MLSKKSKASVILLIFVVLLMISGCSNSQSHSEAEINSPDVTAETHETSTPPTEGLSDMDPLAEKQYEPLVIDANTDFSTLFTSLSNEWSSLVIDLSDYLQLHETEITENNMGFADFEDYEVSLEPYYKFLNSIMYCSSDNIPEEYQEAWTLFKTTIFKNEADLEALYPLKGQDLLDGVTDMFTYVEAGANLVSEAMPKNTAENIEIGQTISSDFVELSIDGSNVSDTILPEDTSRGYSYISDTPNEKYYYITGVIKNLSGNAYSVEDIFAEMVFDDKYTYTAYLAACAWDNSFFGDYVNPLATVKYYIYASVPDELIDTYTKCEISFGFADNFSESKYSLSSGDECDYLYSLTINQ